jgi:hypothetical protein
MFQPKCGAIIRVVFQFIIVTDSTNVTISDSTTVRISDSTTVTITDSTYDTISATYNSEPFICSTFRYADQKIRRLMSVRRTQREMGEIAGYRPTDVPL